VSELLIELPGVADPGMFIPDPRSEFLPSRIQGQKDPGTRIQGKKKKLCIFNPKIVSELSEIWSGMFIPDSDPGSESWFFTHPGPRGQKAPDPGSGFATLELPTCSGSMIMVCLREGGGVYYDRSKFIAGVQEKLHICHPKLSNEKQR
jgi:hypothetical protein